MRIEGLRSGTKHNGRFGFVVGKTGDGERFSVVVAHHDVLLNVKPANLVPERQDRTSRRHDVVMVYPNGKRGARRPDAMLVAAGESSPLRGWPEDYKMETRWLSEVLGWRRPVCVTGVTRDTSSNPMNPDLVIYLDAASEHCLVNEHAEAAIAKLPTWELRKVKNELPEKVRGAVVLVHSPYNVTVRHYSAKSGMDAPETLSSEQPNAGKMSLDDAAVALAYQHMKDPPRPVNRFDHDQAGLNELREMMERHGFGHDVEGLNNERA